MRRLDTDLATRLHSRYGTTDPDLVLRIRDAYGSRDEDPDLAFALRAPEEKPREPTAEEVRERTARRVLRKAIRLDAERKARDAGLPEACDPDIDARIEAAYGRKAG